MEETIKPYRIAFWTFVALQPLATGVGAVSGDIREVALAYWSRHWISMRQFEELRATWRQEVKQ